MSVETSNAPREVWVTLTDRGEPIQVWRTCPTPSMGYGKRAEAYLRRDLVVPTVNELSRKVRELGWTMSAPDALRMAHALRPWLLSRIEGDTDEQ